MHALLRSINTVLPQQLLHHVTSTSLNESVHGRAQEHFPANVATRKDEARGSQTQGPPKIQSAYLVTILYQNQKVKRGSGMWHNGRTLT